jgi:hypothetical protein
MSRAVFVALLGALGAQASRAQTPPAHQLRYTPEGCDYAVATPEVDEARLDGDTTTARPPDHVHASFAGDPSSSFAVNWRSDAETLATRLLYGTSRAQVAAATGRTEHVRLQAGHSLLYRGKNDPDATRLHEVHVCGLKHSTTYFYKVGGPGAFSQVQAVTTAPAPGSTSPFRFGVSGDARDSASVFALIQKGMRDAGAAFELFTGDAVLAGNRQVQWNAFFQASASGTSVQDVLASTPFMVVNGNHEGLSVNYLAQFAMPQRPNAASPAHGEDWYSFDYGNAHFIALNDTTASLAMLEEETAWLDDNLSQLDRKKTPWVIVYHHRPPYSCGANHGSDLAIRQRWQPIFDRYGVDLVVNGHEHQYERSKPIRGRTDAGDGIVVNAGPADKLRGGVGTVYIVSAGAGAGLYGVNRSCPHTQIIEQSYHYIVADVAGGKLSLKTYRLDGSVLDQFTITK